MVDRLSSFKMSKHVTTYAYEFINRHNQYSISPLSVPHLRSRTVIAAQQRYKSDLEILVLCLRLHPPSAEMLGPPGDRGNQVTHSRGAEVAYLLHSPAVVDCWNFDNCRFLVTHPSPLFCFCLGLCPITSVEATT
ncbi:unnamed protein product [Schistocephalus solidus]|uniref:Uncharacterized protein n=1 Tax=Schistocephalus solidus TaxID=70667 RepID=A0A183SWC7_SCHSO|nr:unnamed protein product [Schistocephalus solidus]